jgi:hypothetical protein
MVHENANNELRPGDFLYFVAKGQGTGRRTIAPGQRPHWANERGG